MINIGDNFEYKGKESNFTRDKFKTLSEMKSVSDNNIDEGHISYCEETDKHYKFKSTNSVDTSTGKWREFKQIDIEIKKVTQSEYDSLPIKNENVLYCIVG